MILTTNEVLFMQSNMYSGCLPRLLMTFTSVGVKGSIVNQAACANALEGLLCERGSVLAHDPVINPKQRGRDHAHCCNTPPNP
jgi:hypothetical protein